MRVTCPENVRVRDLALSLILHMVVELKETPLIFSAPCCLWQVGELSCLSQAAALRRVDPAPHLGNTIELALRV